MVSRNFLCYWRGDVRSSLHPQDSAKGPEVELVFIPDCELKNAVQGFVRERGIPCPSLFPHSPEPHYCKPKAGEKHGMTASEAMIIVLSDKVDP